MNENTELALIRTLLATERNYLAMERTQLAQLRNGLSLALIAPSAAATLTYIFAYLPVPFSIDIYTYILLIILTIYGTYESYSANRKLKKTRDIQRLIREREAEVIEKSEILKKYFKEILIRDKLKSA